MRQASVSSLHTSRRSPMLFTPGPQPKAVGRSAAFCRRASNCSNSVFCFCFTVIWFSPGKRAVIIRTGSSTPADSALGALFRLLRQHAHDVEGLADLGGIYVGTVVEQRAGGLHALHQAQHTQDHAVVDVVGCHLVPAVLAGDLDVRGVVGVLASTSAAALAGPASVHAHDL